MTAMTIGARDVRTLLQLSDPWHRSEPVESVWESALSTIKALIPCDAVSFPIQDVAHGGCVSREFTDKYETYLDPGACSDDALLAPVLVCSLQLPTTIRRLHHRHETD